MNIEKGMDKVNQEGMSQERQKRSYKIFNP